MLGLRVLRHEEFESGCEATCNGPYGGAWSKTMVGLGDENCNFVFELTYNYGVDSYQTGNDLQCIALAMPETVLRAVALGYPIEYVQAGILIEFCHAYDCVACCGSCSLLTAHCSLLTAHCLLLSTHCLVLTA